MDLMTLQEVQKKARFGHRDWVFFRDRSGEPKAARLSREAVKAAMLATGSKRHFYLVEASTGILARQNWATGCILMRNVRFLNLSPA